MYISVQLVAARKSGNTLIQVQIQVCIVESKLWSS